MSDELILFGTGLDQPIPDDDWAIQKVDEIIQEAVQKKDPYIAIHAVQSLVKIAKLSGRALAKLLHFLRYNWEVFNSDENFDDVVYVESGLHRHTIDRYIRVHQLLLEAPVDLSQRNMKELIPIANKIAQGWEFEKEEWNKLANAPDYATLSQDLREMTDEKPRKSALILQIDQHGSLWATKEGQRKFVGSLEIDDEDEIVQKAINRICDNSGVLR